MADGSWKPSTLLGSGDLRAVVQSLAVYLDDVKGFIRCTSSTRPVNPKQGWPIYETDTQRVAVWDGSAWNYLAAGNSTGRVGGQWARTANQSIANNTVTALTFDTLVQGYGSEAWTAVPWSTLTMPSGSAGLYVMSATAVWSAPATTRNVVLFTINGNSRGLVGAAGEGSVGSTWVQPLAVGDTILVRVAQGSGGALNCTGFFNLFRIGP